MTAVGFVRQLFQKEAPPAADEGEVEIFGEGDRITIKATDQNGMLEDYFGVILYTMPDLNRVMTCVWTKGEQHIHTDSFGLYDFERWDGVMPQ